MHPERGPVAGAAAELERRFGAAPETGIVLGSGLGVVVDRMDVRAEASAVEVGLPQSTVPGHAGRVLVGRFGGTEIVALKGRVHLYEGWSPWEVVRYVRALAAWGVKRLVLTCSAGGVTNEAGDIMVLNDHINLQGSSPLTGPQYGDVRFPDMSQVHDAHMREVLAAAASDRGIRTVQGVYAALHGPAYETPAEIRMMQAIGADAVGMSTVPELLAAAECGLPVVGIAVIANKAAGLAPGALTHSDVTEKANEVGTTVADLLEAAVGRF